MTVTFNRRSKVLLALVASMTLGSGLLLGLAREPVPPMIPLAAANLRPWHRIVIYESGSFADSLAKMEQASPTGCPYHFVIAADGTVRASSRWKQQLLAPQQTDGTTLAGIQLVLIGKFDQAPPSNEQLGSLRRLLEMLSTQCKIPSHSIFVHSPSCPGPAFPREWSITTPI